MNGFKKMCIGLIFTCIIVGVLTPVSYAAPPSDRCILIKAQVADRDDVDTLANMGLDIWEYREGGLIIRVTDDEREQVQAKGFTVETITEDVYEYTEKIRQEQISLFAEPTTAKYHSHDEVIAELQALEASGVAQTYIIGNTHEGRDIWAVKISDNPSEDEDEPGALFFGCQHAREWIAIEVPLYIAQYLADNYDIDSDVKRLVDNCEIWIVPVVNPDGYEYSRTRDRLWRKNRRDNGDGTFGVDLNRNWGYMWGRAGSSGDTSSITYRGPDPFSEPETQAIRDLVLAYDFRFYIDYHSFGQQTIHPWGYTRDPCPDYLPMSAMTLKMRNLIKQTSGAIYVDWWDPPAPYLPGYVVSGDSTDWGYGEIGIYSFSIELPPITKGQGGFWLAASRILPTCEENLPVALYLISLSAANGGIENLTTGKTYGSIQFAINDATDGDEIVVNPGLYEENIMFRSKNITLRSADPNDPAVVAATVINGIIQGPVIAIYGYGYPDRGCVLDGLTITGEAAGISCCGEIPTIRNCTIESNEPNAIEYCEGFEPIIINCTILGSIVEANADDPILIAYWNLDETEESIAYDNAGENDADVFGGALWKPTEGYINGAIELDGIDDYIGTPFVLNPVGDFSVFSWVKGGAPGQTIISQANGVNWLLADTSEGKLASELIFGRGVAPLVSNVVITDGEWHRVGLTWDRSRKVLYVDDVEVASDTLGGERKTGGLYIGAGKKLEAGKFWSGLIDDVRIYNQPMMP